MEKAHITLYTFLKGNSKIILYASKHISLIKKIFFATYGSMKIFINGVKSTFISFTSLKRNAGKKGNSILPAYVFLVLNNVGKPHFTLI